MSGGIGESGLTSLKKFAIRKEAVTCCRIHIEYSAAVHRSGNGKPRRNVQRIV